MQKPLREELKQKMTQYFNNQLDQKDLLEWGLQLYLHGPKDSIDYLEIRPFFSDVRGLLPPIC